jgi:hypothetical protein
MDSAQLRLLVGASLIIAAIVGCFAVYAALPEEALQVEVRPTPTRVPAPEGAQVVAAPIESAEVVLPAQTPRQPSLRLVAGLPDGCTQPGFSEVTRLGSLFRVQVMNYRQGEVCTQVYGTYELTLQLSSGLGPGRYEVEVNDRRLAFNVE